MRFVSNFVNTSLAECDVHKTSYNNLMKGITFLLKALLKSLAKVIMLRTLWVAMYIPTVQGVMFT
jgi:hypothetical protein